MNAHEKIRENVRAAIAVLSSKFEISDAEMQTFGEPVTEIGTRTRCVYPRTLIFEPHMTDDDTALGEEVSHLLHGIVNPEIRHPKTHDEINSRRYIIECVGHYGALVYLKEKGAPYDNIKWPFAPDCEGDEFFSHLAHEYGYKRAVKLFGLYTDSLLPQVARMDYDTALVALHRLAPLSFYERKIIPAIDRAKVFLPTITRFF